MTTFTLEISGKPIACFRAANHKIAEDMIDEPWFCTDLMSLQLDGQAVWDGNSIMRLREATFEESAVVDERIHASDRANQPLDEDETIFYLVPVTEVVPEKTITRS